MAPPRAIIVGTNEDYRFIVADQLREVGVGSPLVVLEPMGRNTARALAAFVEKPNAAAAQAYLDSGGYVWNSGIFMMKRSVWLAAEE